MIGFNVTSAFDGRDIANFQNDAANSAYNSATDTLNKALQALQAANTTVFDLQQQASQAKNELGAAEFNLNQAMNTLFVAQAAKEQSDKALLLASVQIS
jgi:predicted  nucleic acid-binding Zn-ribbon protein